MTRKIVGYEGKETTDKRLLLPGSVTSGAETIPVMMPGYKLVGKATKFKRDINGEISYDVNIDDEGIPEDLTAVIFMTNMTYHTNEDGVMVIESGVIRSVNLVASKLPWQIIGPKENDE